MKTIEKSVDRGAEDCTEINGFTEIDGRRIHLHADANENAKWCRLSDADLCDRISERLDIAIRESGNSLIAG